MLQHVNDLTLVKMLTSSLVRLKSLSDPDEITIHQAVAQRLRTEGRRRLILRERAARDECNGK